MHKNLERTAILYYITKISLSCNLNQVYIYKFHLSKFHRNILVYNKQKGQQEKLKKKYFLTNNFCLLHYILYNIHLTNI